MQLFIDVTNRNTITIELTSSDTIQQLKSLIERETNIPADKQRLFCCNKPLLYNNKTLNDYRITNLSIINVHVSMLQESKSISSTNSVNNYHSILSLVRSPNDAQYIYECDMNSTLMQVIQDIKVWNFPTGVYQCEIYLLTADLTEPIQLNYRQMNIDTIHKIHASIRKDEAFRIECKYMSQSMILLPRIKTLSKIMEPTDIHQSVTKYASNMIESSTDKSSLLFATRFIQLSLSTISISTLTEIVQSYIKGLSQCTYSKNTLLRSFKNNLKNFNFCRTAINCDIFSTVLNDMIHPCAQQITLRELNLICCQIIDHFGILYNREKKLKPIIKYLSIFMFHEDQELLENALGAFEQIMTGWISSEDIKQIIYNKHGNELMKLYVDKKHQNELLFSGYISRNIGLISNDVASTIWTYFNCYNATKYDFMPRLLYLVDKSHGYSPDIIFKAVSILRSAFRTLDVTSLTSIAEQYDIIDITMNMMENGPISRYTFWLVTHLIDIVEQNMKYEFVQVAVERFYECIRSENEERFNIAINSIPPMIQTINSIREKQIMEDLLQRHKLIQCIMELMDKIMDKSEQITWRWNSIGETMTRLLGLIQFMLTDFDEEIENICTKELKQYGFITLNNIRDRHEQFNTADNRDRILQQVKSILNV